MNANFRYKNVQNPFTDCTDIEYPIDLLSKVTMSIIGITGSVNERYDLWTRPSSVYKFVINRSKLDTGFFYLLDYN